ncbi:MULTISPECIES: DNA cytosine methyltransferase [unclassified Coleofasciculus]|uniref:DNA cytosine methyltransferase n=1 Tax=unclassified Coleofasciculus TaxID=2692782 RepID=UPI00187F3B2D|nr:MULTISPECIES: DNA cytosine methyltransferase [unclassified Coleofasciculus]MBE9126212.1 DNA cytosine methyltransferase [Coleofasciculus sp. LEGE 07081]MBE9148126.1 DNA cytosine methyltransferase [Coleofasciculus sp. LEGE 07092]
MIGISAVDLFCGAGGLTHGFQQAGLPVNVGYDIDPACEFPYEYNNKARFILKSVEEVTGAELIQHFPVGDIKVLAGCAPCQPFSTYSRRYGNKQAEKWELLKDFIRIVRECVPEIVSMENVPQLEQHKVFHEFTSELKQLGYFVTSYKVDCLYYGIPQTRKRLVFFASKFGNINLILPTHDKMSFETVRSTISDMEPLAAGQGSKTDRLHRCSKLSKLNLRRIRASKPGGTWRDWSEELIAECHIKRSGKTYPAVYGRMEWDRPSPTITTQCFGFGNGRFGHPEQDRAISLREAAVLQTFPVNYEFVAPDEPVGFSRVGRLIGNAVPVKLGQVVAQSILNHIKNKS